MTSKNIFTNEILKYFLYLLPVFIIIGNAITNGTLFIVFLIYIYHCIKEKKFLYIESNEFKLFFILFLYLLFNSLLSGNFESILRSIGYLKFFIFVLVYKNFIETKKINLQKLGFVWLVIILLLGLDIVFQAMHGFNTLKFISAIKNRNSGFFMDELVAGAFLLSFVFNIYFLIFKKKNNLIMFFYLFFFLIVIFLTGERANFIKFIFIYFCIYIFIAKLNIKYSWTILIAPLIVFFLLNNISSFKERYLSSISFASKNNLSILNTYLTSEYGSHTISSLYILKDNLFFGVGTKNFRNSCDEYSTYVIEFQKKIVLNNGEVYPSGCATHPHQIYNELLSEHGLLGTFFFLFIFYKLLFKNFRKNKKINLNIVAFLYILTTFIPILPSGSFFSSLNSILFWINFLFYNIKLRGDE